MSALPCAVTHDVQVRESAEARVDREDAWIARRAAQLATEYLKDKVRVSEYLGEALLYEHAIASRFTTSEAKYECGPAIDCFLEGDAIAFYDWTAKKVHELALDAARDAAIDEFHKVVSARGGI